MKCELLEDGRLLVCKAEAEIERLNAQRDELLAALRFYADPATYSDEAWQRGDDENPCSIEWDQGNRARAAIAKAEGK